MGSSETNAVQILGAVSGSYYEEILLLFSCFDIHDTRAFHADIFPEMSGALAA